MKFSLISQNNSPAIGDNAVGVTAAGVDQKSSWTSIAALISANLSSASVKKATIDFTSFDVFSTSELDTGRKWIDGRTIYRKVLSGNLNIIAGACNVAHGISGITALEVLRVDGCVRLSSTVRGTSVNLFYHREAAGNWMHPTAWDATNVSITSSFAWGTTAYTYILEYVK